MTSVEDISTAVSKWMAQGTNQLNQKNKNKISAALNVFFHYYEY